MAVAFGAERVRIVLSNPRSSLLLADTSRPGRRRVHVTVLHHFLSFSIDAPMVHLYFFECNGRSSASQLRRKELIQF